MSRQSTVFGSIGQYQKGGVQVIDDNPKHYVFSNAFDIASKSQALREGRRRRRI